LGCYSLALLVTGQLYGLANILAIVVAPRVAERYGQAGDRRAAAELTARCGELQAAMLALPAALTVAALPPLLGTLLPDYGLGLAPMRWLLPGVIASGLALLPVQYLLSVDRQKWSLAAIVLATAATAGACHVALVCGYGLVGVAAASSLGSVLYLLLVAVPVWSEMRAAGRLHSLAMHALALGPALLAAFALEAWPAARGAWTLTAAKSLSVVLVWALSLGAGWRWGGWREALRPRCVVH
jgi:O-antigen/teichoic acid export membrane protein